jgi:hypothetical protein
MQFSDILTNLPTIDHLSALELYDGETMLARLDNKPGSAGSVRVYHALFQEFGVINRAAAEKGLGLYAEHTADAKNFPGKHPNIDRLFSLVEKTDIALQVKLVQQECVQK